MHRRSRKQKPIKLGYVSPQTGPLAAFAEADNFVLGQFREATKGGLKIGNAHASDRSGGARTASPIRTAPPKSRKN